MAAIFPPIRWGAREVGWTWVPATTREMAEAARPVFAEFLGTLAFVFIAGSFLVLIPAAERGFSTVGLLILALGTALAYAIIVTALYPVSGGHVNPAVTLGHLVARRIPPAMAILYWAAQMIGGVLGALMLQFVYRDVADAAARQATLAFGEAYRGSWAALFTGGFLEAALTFLLVLTFLMTLVDPRGQRAFGALAVGLAVLVATLLAFPLTGAALNPARVLGTAVVANHWSDFAMYWMALLGGLLAGLVYDFLGERPEERRSPQR